MTKQQKARLLRIARNDCFCAGENKHGNMTCIIGAMAVATLRPQSNAYREMIQNSGDGIGADCLKTLKNHLCLKFGLDEEQLEKLQYENDKVRNDINWPDEPNPPGNIKQRREAVMNVIRRFKVEGKRK